MTQDTKWCNKCGQWKGHSEFYRRNTVKDGLQSNCKACVLKWRNEDYRKRPGIEERHREAARRSNAKTRLQVIEAYGGKCVCCGESEPKFLSIDHVNGGGCRHREEIGDGGQKIARFLKKNGYPKDGFQLLCFNCNCAKGFFGVCPHQTQHQQLDTRQTCVGDI